MNRNTVVLAQPWGGLGDNLQYSNLPKLYNNQNYDFKISYFNFERNKNIYNFCWKLNPYSSGKTIMKPNIGWNKWIDNYKAVLKNRELNAIQVINVCHGFEAGDGYPSIYLDNNYNLRPIDFKFVADFNAISSIPSENGWNYIFDQIKNYKYTSLQFPTVKDLKNNSDFFESKENINVNSIFDTIDILSRTDTFICLYSGSQTLAAALRKKIGRPNKIISFIPNPEQIEKYDGRFMFDNVDYETIDGNHEGKMNDKKIEKYTKILNYLT
tara:strand:+ start:2674 stop:3480 length:807 start_codon:yes stop_codon:yes gene_type:complete